MSISSYQNTGLTFFFVFHVKECTKLRNGECIPPGPRPSDPRPTSSRPPSSRPSGYPSSQPPHPGHLDPRPTYPRPPDPSSLDHRPSYGRQPDSWSSNHDQSISAHYIPTPLRPRAPGPKSTCPVACPAIYQPVCADCQETGETTFENICELEVANTCNPYNRK